MSYDTVLRGGTVATATATFEADIAIAGGRIAAVGLGLAPGTREIAAAGRLITPGGVDPHCHIEQLSGMGVMSADDFDSGTAAAAMGGTTSVISFAAQKKGERPADAIADYAARARRGARIDHAFHFSVTDPTAPHFADDIATLAGQGHRTVKVFTTYAIALSEDEVLRIMDVTGPAGALLCVHAETDAIVARERARLLAAGRVHPRDHAASRPIAAEVEAVRRVCRFAELSGAPTMIFHVTSAEAVDEIRMARARGAPVWAETCTHYLFQTEADLDRPGLEGAKWMCSPPQRSQADQDALWDALDEGVLSVVSSDHAPYRFDETGKLSSGSNPSFDKIANGQPGLELRQPLLFDAMVSKGRLGAQKFVELTSTAPARLYGLSGKGDIAPGFDADLVIWDTERSHTYGADDLHDNVGYNPFEGRTITGWPETVILRGETIVSDGALRAEPGTGTWIDRPRIGATA